jgi:hypothetical protein
MTTTKITYEMWIERGEQPHSHPDTYVVHTSIKRAFAVFYPQEGKKPARERAFDCMNWSVARGHFVCAAEKMKA